MALSKIDVANMLTGEVPNANVATIGVAKGGTGLTSGTTGQLLKFTGSTTLASSAISTGKIGQVIQATRRGEVTTTSSSFTAFTELSASITPTATSSKILVEAEIHCHTAAGKAAYMDLQRAISGGSTTQLGITLDSNAIQGFSYRIGFANLTTVNGLGYLRIPITYLDSPSTTSACTYSPVGKSETGGQTSYFFNNGNISTMTVSEVLA
tara:strand:+ start:219 stop:848 length:630 start_codon:yes stop_codon:yes gene_type:complete